MKERWIKTKQQQKQAPLTPLRQSYETQPKSVPYAKSIIGMAVKDLGTFEPS